MTPTGSNALRVGIIGCGAAGTAHAAAISALSDRLRLTSVHDTDEARAAVLAAATGATPTTLDDLLATVDAVCIATPDPLHAVHLMAACRHRVRGAVVESPAVLTSHEARTVADAANRAGSRIIVALSDVPLPTSVDLGGTTMIRTVSASTPGWIAGRQRSDPSVAVRGAFARRSACLQATGADEPADEAETVHAWAMSVLVNDLAIVRARGLTALEVTVRPEAGGGYRGRIQHVDGTTSLQVTCVKGAPAGRSLVDRHSRVHPLTWTPSERAPALEDTWVRLSGLLQADVDDDPLLLEHVTSDISAAEGALLADGGGTRTRQRPNVAGTGAGVMATVHLGLASTHGDIIRVGSRNVESAEPLAMLLGAQAARADDTSMFDGADLAIIAGPPGTHARHALRALAQGCAVLVEKPMTATVAEARLLAEAAAEPGAKLVYAENWAYQPTVVRAVDAARGLNLRWVRVEAIWPRPGWIDLLDPSYGGAAVFDGGPHVIELARLLLGRPRATRVLAGLSDGGSAVDLIGDLQIDFEEGLHAHVRVDFTGESGHVTATGDRFHLELSPGLELRVDGSAADLSHDPSPTSWTGLGYVAQIRALMGADPVRATAEDGLATMEIIAAAYASAASGQPVDLPFTGRTDLTPWQLWRDPQAE